MLLAIDIGNTNIVLGLFNGGKLAGHFRYSTVNRSTVDDAGLLLVNTLERMSLPSRSEMAVVIASVVPCLTKTFEQAVEKYLSQPPLVVTSDIKLPITIAIDNPRQLGADRIANAAAGFALYSAPVIIVDFGTATTFDVVDGKGAYIGGVIIPGPETSMAELARKAAQLFEIKITPPERVIGKSTTQALTSGLFYGTIGQVDFIIENIVKEAGFAKCSFVGTGGFSRFLEGHSRYLDVINPTLTLEGLRLIHEHNFPS